MIRSPACARLVALSAAALMASGCISLLPKAKPVELYRFGQPVAAASVAAAPGSVGVFRATGSFQQESAGDRLLTLTAGQVAYVAQTRWVAPASVLWDAAVLAAFDADPGRARIISRGEPGTAVYVLRLDVRNFETHYDNGPKAAPTVVVRVRAAMTGGSDRRQIGERLFEARVPAADNRVSAILPAYDRAVAEVLKEVVAWTNEQAAPV